MACDTCGHEHLTRTGKPACPGHKKPCPPGCTGHPNGKPCRTGGPCTQAAGWGTGQDYGLCKYHGGNSPGGRVQAANQAANDLLRRVLDNPDAPAVTDPLRELLALAGRLKHASIAIGTRVNDLEERIRYRGGEGGAEQLRAEVQVWERLLAQLGRTLTDIARLGIEDRLARIEQQKVDALIRALDAAFGDAHVPRELATEVKGHLVRHLRVAG